MNLFVTFLWNDSITLNSPFTNYITYTVFVSSAKLVSRDLMFSSRPFIKCSNYLRTRKRAFRVSLEKIPDHWRFSVCIYRLRINLFAITLFNICNIDILFFSFLNQNARRYQMKYFTRVELYCIHINLVARRKCQCWGHICERTVSPHTANMGSANFHLKTSDYKRFSLWVFQLLRLGAFIMTCKIILQLWISRWTALLHKY